MIKYQTPFKTQSIIAGDVLAYLVPINTVAQSRALTFHNPSETSIQISVHIVPSNITEISPASRILKKTVAAGESYLCPEIANHNLQAGDKVYFSGEGVNATFSVAEQNV